MSPAPNRSACAELTGETLLFIYPDSEEQYLQIRGDGETGWIVPRGSSGVECRDHLQEVIRFSRHFLHHRNLL
jgi:hypothetical protein